MCNGTIFTVGKAVARASERLSQNHGSNFCDKALAKRFPNSASSLPACDPAKYNNFANGNAACCTSSVHLSSKAQMMMTMMGMFSSLLGGDFGRLMDMLGGFNPQGAMQFPPNGGGFLPTGNPGFGQPRANASAPCGAAQNSAAARDANALQNANIPGVSPGEVREMKPGETVRGANGSVITWHPDGTVTVNYQDKNGRPKDIRFKDGMISFDGGKPQKLENVGHILKLPNGDVFGLGHNPGPNGKELVRVVMADSVDKIRTEPANATNIYDVEMMQQQQTRMQGGGYSINMSAGSYATPCGIGSFLNANITALPSYLMSQTIYGDQFLRYSGMK